MKKRWMRFQNMVVFQGSRFQYDIRKNENITGYELTRWYDAKPIGVTFFKTMEAAKRAVKKLEG